MESFYRVKKIEFHERELSILTQSENGPCPLLAISNSLILKGLLEIHPDYSSIQHNDLVSLVASIMLEQIKSDFDPNWNFRINEAINILPRLAVGLDVNVKFFGYFLHRFTDFEFTAECDIFALLGIKLIHGWIVENPEEKQAIGEMTYNQAVEFVCSNPGEQTELIQRFLNDHSTQLTESGLRQIRSGLNEGEVAVFFRNNHFSTVFKYLGSVFSLATDVAFVEEDQVVWECLETIGGNNHFCNCFFIPLEASQNTFFDRKRNSQDFCDNMRRSSPQKFDDQVEGELNNDIEVETLGKSEKVKTLKEKVEKIKAEEKKKETEVKKTVSQKEKSENQKEKHENQREKNENQKEKHENQKEKTESAQAKRNASTDKTGKNSCCSLL